MFLPGESPWTEEPGGLQSLGLQRVGLDRRTMLSTVLHSGSPTTLRQFSVSSLRRRNGQNQEAHAPLPNLYSTFIFHLLSLNIIYSKLFLWRIQFGITHFIQLSHIIHLPQCRRMPQPFFDFQDIAIFKEFRPAILQSHLQLEFASHSLIGRFNMSCILQQPCRSHAESFSVSHVNSHRMAFVSSFVKLSLVISFKWCQPGCCNRKLFFFHL